MSNQPRPAPLVDDDRAVAPVIGVVILFGFLILTLSVYQVEVVPQQNAEAEFQHVEDVHNDLVELRAGILQAGSIDQPQYQTVQLGTTYQTRIFAINPPSPAGTIQTTDAYPITIAYERNGTVIETIPTRFIQYRTGYNELGQSQIWYDASVLYADARTEGGGIAVIEDQALADGDQVQITALQNEFQQSGSGRATVELRPARDVAGEIPNADLNVTIPTRLNETDWESKTTLTDESAYRSVTETDDDIDGFDVYNLTLTTTADDLTVDTVGVQKAPEDPTQNNNARVGNVDTGNGGDTGSGVGDNFQVTFDQINNKNVRLTFRNENGFEVDVVRIRLDSYTDANAAGNPVNALQFQDGDSNPVLMQNGQFRTVNIQPFPNGSSQDYTLSPQRSSGNAQVQSGDEFTLTLEFENDDTQQYNILVT